MYMRNNKKTKRVSQNSKKTKQKKEFSKIVVTYTLILSTVFLLFICYEMHRLGDLSPIAYIGTGIVGLLTIVIGAYMWRAKQKDLVYLEFELNKKILEIKKESGEDFEYNRIEPLDN